MDIGAILETGVMIILGYGIMFGIIVLLMLPFLYSINLYERMKNHRLVTQENLVNPLENRDQNQTSSFYVRHKRFQKDRIKKSLTKIRKQIRQQDVKIRDQRLQLSQLSETNHQLVRILIDMRESLRH